MFYDKLLERLEVLRDGSDEFNRASIQKKINNVLKSRVFLLDSEQVEVFMERSYKFENYPRFVFPNIFINFTHPLEIGLEGTELSISNSSHEVTPVKSRTARYKGVMVAQDRFVTLRGGLKIKDIIGPIRPDIADTANATEDLTGCASEWYEDFPKSGDIYLDSHTTLFTPDSFPDLANRDLQQNLGSLRLSEKLHGLAVNLLYFLSCENLHFEYRDPNRPEVKRFMRGIGHSTRRPFYTVDFKKSGYTRKALSEGEGPKHSFIYDVTGHIRHLRDERYRRHPDGTYRTLWIHDHQRGLANEIYIPALRDATKMPKVAPPS